MTEQEMREKICEIISPYVSAWGDDTAIVDALIEAGLRFGENHTATFNMAQLDRINELERRLGEAERRAEVAEKGKMISKYDIEYMGVKCTEVEWNEPIYTIFHFVKDGKTYNFVSKKHYDCSADTDHIRCVIEEEFLPYWKDEHIKQLETKNDELKARLEKAVELPCRVGDTVYSVFKFPNEKTVLKGTCKHININICSGFPEIFIKLDFETNEQLFLRTYSGNDLNNIFLLRSEAEARLKDLREWAR